MAKAWGTCQRHRDHAKGIKIMVKAWRPGGRHGDHAKGMETMPKAWRLCPRPGDHAQGVKTTPKDPIGNKSYDFYRLSFKLQTLYTV